MIPELEDPVPLGGGSICDAYRSTWHGRRVFAKTLRNSPPGFFAAEQRGLAWLGEVGAHVPDVLHVDDDAIVLAWIDPGAPDRAAADGLGRELAQLHRCETPTFGAGWPGYIGSLPMDNATTYAAPEQWRSPQSAADSSVPTIAKALRDMAAQRNLRESPASGMTAVTVQDAAGSKAEVNSSEPGQVFRFVRPGGFDVSVTYPRKGSIAAPVATVDLRKVVQ